MEVDFMKKGDVSWLSNPDSVFHYTKCEIALEHIFQSGEIRFGGLGKANDPYESEIWNFEPGYFEFEDNEWCEKQIEAQSRTIWQRIHKRTKFFCTTQFEYKTKLKIDNSHCNRGYTVYPLWTHYADMHKGVCLVFNKNKLHEIIISKASSMNLAHYYGEVKYTPPDFITTKCPSIHKNDGIENSILKDIERRHDNILFAKHSTWESENEYRFVVICNDDEDFKVDISNAITGVVLGMLFPVCYAPLINEAQAKYKIKVAQIDLDEYVRGNLLIVPF
jgi:hypothetical protein